MAQINSGKLLAAVMDASNTAQADANAVSRDAATKLAVLALLAELGGSRVQEDALDFQGSRFVLPEQFKGRLPEASKWLLEYEEQQNAETDMNRTFPYRCYDVANAVQLALKKVFGTTGVGTSIQTMFGSIPPEFVTVPNGVGTTTEVPWNRVKFDALSGHIDIGAKRTSDGIVGIVSVTAPRKYRSMVQGFFNAVEEELKSNSLYRGKAVINGSEIKFLDTTKVKREDVVYGDAVMADLEANLWTPIRHADALREQGIPLKRAVLLEGPYGTGKSLAGYLTAQSAQQHSWTFIMAPPGEDLNEAMQTAKLYAPAVVFFEDIDVLQSNDPEAVSKLLDSFDGIGGKGQEVIAVLTTNNKDKIHKGMLRPGRLDALIHIAELDAGGVEKLIKAAIPREKLVNIDYAEIFKSVEGYLPAFVREVANRAYRYAMARVDGVPEALFTEDFTSAAGSLRPQFDLMTGASEIKERTGLGAAMREEIKEVLESTTFFDIDNDKVGSDLPAYAPWHTKVNLNK